MTGLRVDPDVADLPPSCKLVYLVLREDGPATQAQIRAQTLLPDRTARSALARLEDEGLLEKRRVAGDATKTRYSVVDCERG